MKKLIIRLPGAMVLAITFILAGSGPLCAQSALRPAALPQFDRIYQQSLRGMQNEARAVGLRIDTDIDVLLNTATSHVLLATIDGFEDIVLDDTGLNEFDWGFANVAGIEGLPGWLLPIAYRRRSHQAGGRRLLFYQLKGRGFRLPARSYGGSASRPRTA